ncbi:alpha/beta-gliadin MM1-like [Daphnia pulex]|uniref:alpha/beta-gliadin MM1-like n=1 Tax=Daphnia pulex TaxID=6669 RepID=UPI001EE087A3|nr:alpha/beta-gliadin MM1-like [Daphnia pulex]
MVGGPLVQLRPVGRSNSGESGSRDRRSPMHDALHPKFHPLLEEIMAPPLIPPPPPIFTYHEQQPPVIIPNSIQPNPPVPRHSSTPPCSNGRVHHHQQQQQQQQQAPPLFQQQQQLQNLSPIRSCSETESGSSLGIGLSMQGLSSGS